MITVYKYVLPVMDVCTVMIPRGAEFLTVGEQRGDVCLWAKVDTEKDVEEMTFRIAGTGHALANGKFSYIGTVMMCEGTLVFHVFECAK